MARLSDSVSVPSQVVARLVGDETVILNLETSVYYGLDSVGSRIWNIAEENGNLQSVFDALKEEYDVAPDVLQQDILRLADELAAKGLLTISA
jgi:hypothetical protein